jgi:DegV family protein with EDD domain
MAEDNPMLRIVMDSAGDLPAEWAAQYDIQTIPINIHFGERTFYQGVDLSNEEFYQLVDQSGTIPKTSQPTPHQFVNFYQRIAQAGDTILSVHVTSKLSGTYESAEIAARQLQQDYKIYPVDSGGGSASQGFMCKEARQMDQAGMSVEKILERLKFIKEHTEIVLTLNTLTYARMSGRVKALQAALASLLNVKPIITLADGVLDVTEKVRTRSRAIERLVAIMAEKVGDRLVNMAVVHARDHEMGKKLLRLVESAFHIKELFYSELSIGIAANLGPGTVGIVAYPVQEG